MTTIIKIDRSQVRRNPNAGQTQSHILNGEKVLFDYAVIGKSDFDKLKRLQSENRNIFITKQGQLIGSDLFAASGFLESSSVIETLPQKGLMIGIEKLIETVNHLPEPSYLFAYKPTKVDCSNCERKVNHNDIERDCNDCGCWDSCPHCGAEDTFDYEYEDIYKVAKELNL